MNEFALQSLVALLAFLSALVLVLLLRLLADIPYRRAFGLFSGFALAVLLVFFRQTQPGGDDEGRKIGL